MVVDRRKKARELAALDKGVRRKPLEKQSPVWAEAVQSIALATLGVLILLGAIWLFVVQLH